MILSWILIFKVLIFALRTTTWIFMIILIGFFELKYFTNIFCKGISCNVRLLFVYWSVWTKKQIFHMLFTVWFSQRGHSLESIWCYVLFQVTPTYVCIEFWYLVNFISPLTIFICLLTNEFIFFISFKILTQINTSILMTIFFLYCL